MRVFGVPLDAVALEPALPVDADLAAGARQLTLVDVDAGGVADQLVAILAGALVPHRQVDTLLVAAAVGREVDGVLTFGAAAFRAQALVDVAKIFGFVLPSAAVVLAVADVFQSDAHLAVAAAVELSLWVATD